MRNAGAESRSAPASQQKTPTGHREWEHIYHTFRSHITVPSSWWFFLGIPSRWKISWFAINRCALDYTRTRFYTITHRHILKRNLHLCPHSQKSHCRTSLSYLARAFIQPQVGVEPRTLKGSRDEGIILILSHADPHCARLVTYRHIAKPLIAVVTSWTSHTLYTLSSVIASFNFRIQISSWNVPYLTHSEHNSTFQVISNLWPIIVLMCLH